MPCFCPSGRARKILAALALTTAVAPLFVALVAAHDDGWRPLGDDAVITVLTHDVLSARSPLLGMPTTISASNDPHRSHHPGPMEFWSLAPLERLFGSGSIGILLGVVIVNAAAVVTVGIVLSRLAGARTAAAALALCAVLAWALGRQIVVDPWNPYIALFPMLALCVLTWAAVAGRQYALWGVALIASYVAQAHTLYAPLAVGLFASAGAGVAASMLRRRRREELPRRDVVVTGGGTLAVLALAWALPVYDQIAGNPGNFTATWREIRASRAPSVGGRYALRVMAQAIGAPPLFLRRTDSIERIGVPWGQPGALRVATAALLVVVLVGATAIAFRRRDRVTAAAGAVACVALAITGGVVAELPSTFINIPEYRLLQCWVIGAFVWLVTGFVGARAIAPRLAHLPKRLVRVVRVAALAPIVAVLVSAPIAIAYADSEGRQDTRLYPATARLAAGIATQLTDTRDSYLLDFRGDQGVLSLTIGYGVFRELTRRGIDVGVPSYDYYLTRSHRAPDGAPHLVIVSGRAAVDRMRRSHDRVLVRFGLATKADDARLRRTTDALRSSLRERSNLLTDKGRRVLSAGAPASDVATLDGLFDGSLDAITLLDNGRLGQLWATGLLRQDLFASRAFADYNAARHTVDDLVFAAYLEPAQA